MSDLSSKIEAILFAYGEPMNIPRLSSMLGAAEEEVRAAVLGLREALKQNFRGLVVIERGDEVQLGTRPEYGDILQKFFQEEFHRDLTPAALETLSIVIYRGPISRPSIDAIRGVNSSFMLRSLLLRGLIDREPDPRRHNVWLYRHSLDFLKLLGITNREELPEFVSLTKSLDELEKAGENQT